VKTRRRGGGGGGGEKEKQGEEEKPTLFFRLLHRFVGTKIVRQSNKCVPFV
jgi:hypothetical protein